MITRSKSQSEISANTNIIPANTISQHLSHTHSNTNAINTASHAPTYSQLAASQPQQSIKPIITTLNNTITNNSNTQNSPTYKYTIRNIPEAYASQKKLHTFFTTNLPIPHKTIIYNHNKTALVVTSKALPSNFEDTLKTAAGTFNISISPINPPKTRQNPTTRPLVFSIVARGIPQDVDENDVVNALKACNIDVHKCWRIKSRQTNTWTRLVRILLTDNRAVAHLINHGLCMFGRVYPCEPSLPPAPRPVQCTKCFNMGHLATECPNKPQCPTCVESNHAPGKCPAKEPACAKCQGMHPAYSPSCPVVKAAPVTPETPMLPVHIIPPPPEFADPEPQSQSPADPPSLFKVMAIITKVLLDLHPQQRPQVQKIVEAACREITHLPLRLSHSGRNVLLTFDIPA